MDWQNMPDNRQQIPDSSKASPKMEQPLSDGGMSPNNEQACPPSSAKASVPPQTGWQMPAQGQIPTGNPYNHPPVPPSNGFPPVYHPYAPYPQGNWTTVPYYQQQGQPPMPYGQGPAYSGYGNPYMPQQPVDPAKPILVMGSRRMTKEQYSRLNNASSGVLVGLQVVLGLLVLIFGAASVMAGLGYGDTPAFITCAVLTVISLVVMAVSAGLRRRRRQKQINKAYSCSQEAGDGSSIVEVYVDRAESISPRGRSVVWYTGATLTEYADMLVLMGPGAAIVWRAEDVTPAQLQILQSVIYPQLRVGARQIRGMFYPQAFAPLPIPEIINHDEVCLTFHVAEEKPLGFPTTGTHFLHTLPIILPLMTIFSVYMANSVAITTSILMDLVLYLMIFWVGGMVATLLLVALIHSISQKKVAFLPADYAITRDGLARQWGGGTLFVPASYVIPTVKPDGVQLDIPYGRLKIAWEDVPDRQAFTDRLQYFGPHKIRNQDERR